MQFLSMWLRGSITITNINSDNPSPWNMCLGFHLGEAFFPDVSSTHKFFMVSSKNFWLRLISCIFWDSLWPCHMAFCCLSTWATFFHFVFLSLCWSMYSRSQVPLVPLMNCLLLISQYYYLCIWKFFLLSLADGFSLELEWWQIFSSIQDHSSVFWTISTML